MKVKKLNNKIDNLLIDWLKSIIPKEEHNKINKKNYKQFLPKEEYIQKNKTYYLSMYTYRWTKQNIKKLLKLKYNLKNITINNLEKLTAMQLSNETSMSANDQVL
tara:strand:+ start:297 stop:611 length:315 start_codon:yes stop_codon:yes gene_type:complete